MEEPPVQPPVDLGAALGSLESLYATVREEQGIGRPENEHTRLLLAAIDAIHGRVAALHTGAITAQPVSLESATDAILAAEVGTATMQEIRGRSAQTHGQLSSLLSGAIERASGYDRARQLQSLQAIGTLGDGYQLHGDLFLTELTRRTNLAQRVRQIDAREQVAGITDRVRHRYGPESAAIIPGLIMLSGGNTKAIDRLSREWCRNGKEPGDARDNPFRVLARFIAIFSDVSQDVISYSLHHGAHAPHARTACKDRSVQATQRYAGNVLEQIITSRELALLDDLDEDAVTERLFTSLAEYSETDPGRQNRHPWFWAEKLGKSIYDPGQIATLLTPEVPRTLLAQILTDLNNLDAVKRGLVDVPVEIVRPSPAENPAVTPEQYARTEALKRIYGVMSLGEVPMPPELALRLFNYSLLQGGPTAASEQFVKLMETLRKAHIGQADRRSSLEQTMLFQTLATLLQRKDRAMPLDLPLTSTKLAGTTPRELLLQLTNTVFPPDVIRGVARPNRRTPAEEMYTPPDTLEPSEQPYFDSATVGLTRRHHADAARRWFDSQGGRWPERFPVACRTFAHACSRMFRVEHVSPFAEPREKEQLREARGLKYVPYVYPSATTAFQAYLEQLEPDPGKRRVVMSNQEHGTLVGREDSAIAKGGRVADLKIVPLWDDRAQRLRTGEELAAALLNVMDDATTLVVLSSLTRFGEVPCGNVQELGRALKTVRTGRAGKKHVPILIDGAQAFLRLHAANQLNTLMPDAWLGSGTKLAGAGQVGFISLCSGTLSGREDGSPFTYDVSTVSLEGMFIMERLMHNASMRGCNLRHYGGPATFGPDVGAQTVEDENLERLQDLTALTLHRALDHGTRVWSEVRRRTTCEPQAVQQQLATVWRRLQEQDERTESRHIRTMIFHAERRAARERETDVAKRQLEVLKSMAGGPVSRPWMMSPEQTDAFGSALFGMNIRSPSHPNIDAYGGIVTASLPFLSGRALETELPRYHGIRLAACGPKKRWVRFGLDDRQKPEVVGGLFDAIGRTQIHHALTRLEEGRPLRAIFDTSAEDAGK